MKFRSIILVAFSIFCSLICQAQTMDHLIYENDPVEIIADSKFMIHADVINQNVSFPIDLENFELKKDGFVTENDPKYFIKYADVPDDNVGIINAFSDSEWKQDIPNAYLNITKQNSFIVPLPK